LVERAQHRFQPLRVEAANDAAIVCDRDRAVFFADHDGDGISGFGDADRGAMTGTEGATDVGIGGQRQKTAGRPLCAPSPCKVKKISLIL
jgi:hypothetical protein